MMFRAAYYALAMFILGHIWINNSLFYITFWYINTTCLIVPTLLWVITIHMKILLPHQYTATSLFWIVEPNHWWHTTSNEWTYRDTNQNVNMYMYLLMYIIQYDLVSKLNLWKLSKKIKINWNAFIEEMLISFCWKWFYRLDDNRITIRI